MHQGREGLDRATYEEAESEEAIVLHGFPNIGSSQGGVLSGDRHACETRTRTHLPRFGSGPSAERPQHF
jgi:hypothetical protein